MPIDPKDMESPEKAGYLMAELGDHPQILREMLQEALGRNHTLPGATPRERAEETGRRLHRLVRAVERYGREVGSTTFEEAVETFIDDAEREVAGAREWMKRGLRGESFSRAPRQFNNPTLRRGAVANP